MTAAPSVTQAQLDHQIHINSNNIDAANQRTVSENTTKEDIKYRRLCSAWCISHNFEDKDTVYDAKWWLYIN